MGKTILPNPLPRGGVGEVRTQKSWWRAVSRRHLRWDCGPRSLAVVEGTAPTPIPIPVAYAAGVVRVGKRVRTYCEMSVGFTS
jgi:hypothetical protein